MDQRLIVLLLMVNVHSPQVRVFQAKGLQHHPAIMAQTLYGHAKDRMGELINRVVLLTVYVVQLMVFLPQALQPVICVRKELLLQ